MMALSKMSDIKQSYKGQDYIFVDQSDAYLKELECPICRDIVSEPLLTSCGHLFCRECHSKLGGGYHSPEDGYRTVWRIQCPMCQQQHTTVQDKFNERRVKALQVRCTNYQYGCKWVGNLDDEMQHRKRQNSCHFEEIKCPHGCGQTIRRMTQSHHMNECQMRLHRCKYCGEEGQYWKIVQDHLQSCVRYPVRCPNGCNKRIPREDTASYKLEKTVSTMETELQAERQRLHDLASESKERIRQLKSDTKAKTERIHDLERETTAMARRIHDLERDAEAKVQRIHDLEEDTITKEQCIQALHRDVEAKTVDIQGLQRDAEANKEHTHDLERDIKLKAERIQGLARDAQAMTAHNRP